MKKSELYQMAQFAVVNTPSISPENKLEILKELFDKEELFTYCEKTEEQRKEKENNA